MLLGTDEFGGATEIGDGVGWCRRDSVAEDCATDEEVEQNRLHFLFVSSYALV